MARAEAFYDELLNTELEEAKMDGLEMWIFPHAIEKTGATGALVRHEMRPPNLHGRLVYISVPDCWGKAKLGSGKEHFSLYAKNRYWRTWIYCHYWR